MIGARSTVSPCRPGTQRKHNGPGRALIALLLMVVAAPTTAGAACEPSSLAADAPIALVLSGGGAKGAYEAGVATALVRLGVPIRLAAGSSAGALNAAMLADGRIDELERLWRVVTRDRVYALRGSLIAAGLLPGWLTLYALDRSRSLFDPEPLRALITTSLDLERVRASAMRLLVVTTDLAERQRRVFDNRTVSVEALMAATAVPGAFPPVEINGAPLVDGGLIGRAPVLEALGSGVPVDRVVVVMSYAPGERGTPPATMRETLEQAFEMSMINQIERDTELARLKFPGVDVQLLTPSAPLQLRPLDFDPGAMSRALAQGREDALACVTAWRRQ